MNNKNAMKVLGIRLTFIYYLQKDIVYPITTIVVCNKINTYINGSA